MVGLFDVTLLLRCVLFWVWFGVVVIVYFRFVFGLNLCLEGLIVWFQVCRFVWLCGICCDCSRGWFSCVGFACLGCCG